MNCSMFSILWLFAAFILDDDICVVMDVDGREFVDVDDENSSGGVGCDEEEDDDDSVLVLLPIRSFDKSPIRTFALSVSLVWFSNYIGLL